MNRTRPVALTLGSILLAGAATAQQPLTPQSFFPAGYDSEIYFNVQKAVDGGLLEAVNGTFRQFTLDQFSQHWGFPLEDAKELRCVSLFGEADGRVRVEQIWTMHGKKSIGMPKEFGYVEKTEEKIGGVPVVTEQRWDGEVSYVSPHAGLVVSGPKRFIEAALARKSRGGRPSAGLMTLTARKGSFADVAIRLNDAMRDDLPPFMDQSWLTEADPLEYFVFRAIESYDDEDDIDATYTVEGVLRCPKGAGGAARIEQKVREGLDWLQKDKQLGAFKHVWKAVKVESDETDVKLSLELGKPREAIGILSSLMVPMFTARAVEVQAVQVMEIEEVVEEEEEVVEEEVDTRREAPAPRPASRPTRRR